MKKTVLLFLTFLFTAILAMGLTSCGAVKANGISAKNKKAEQLVTFLYAKKYDEVEAMFDSKMKSSIPVSSLKRYWGNISTVAGKYECKMSVTNSTEKGTEYSVVSSVHSSCDIQTRVAFDNQGKVTGLWFNFGSKAVAASSKT